MDSLLLSGKTYYLTPDGPIGQKPYNLLLQAMREEGLNCVAQVVMHGREQLVKLRPLGKLICMEILCYEDQVKKPAEFEDEVAESQFSEDELDLTKRLIEATTSEDFDISKYHNVYNERLTQLIEAKVEGKEIVAPPDEQPQQVINLMDALKASVAQAQETSGASTAKPKKKVAASSTKRKTAGRKKKTG